MPREQRARILCVDDDAAVLDGIDWVLRSRYEVRKATSAAAGLTILEKERDIAVVISDMRMPEMNGAAFLAQVRELLPDTSRILLTGQADLDSTISAINDGQIFRFLSKPCSMPDLVASVNAALERYRLITGERVLVEQTLRGSIQTLMDVLALTNPIAFGHATRIKRNVIDLEDRLGIKDRWELEVAAMLSQLGFITLPAETLERIHYGKALSEPEQKMVASVPGVTERLLANIPRLEGVREILDLFPKPRRPISDNDEPRRRSQSRAAHVLRVAVDFDALETKHRSVTLALQAMQSNAEVYEPAVLAALIDLCQADDIKALPMAMLQVGMVFAADVVTSSGMLLATRGYEVTASFVERTRNFRPGLVKDPVMVMVRRADYQPVDG